MIVIEEAMLVQVVKEIIGRGIKVEVRNRPMGHAFAPGLRGARVEIVVPRVLRKVGEDERRENKVFVDVDGAPVEQLEEEYVCTREGTISFRVECDSGIRVDLRAVNLAEDLRNAFRRSEWRDRLRACGFAVADMREIVDLEFAWDDRMIDVAILDVDFNATYSYTISDADYFTRVNDDANHVPRDPDIPTPEQPEGSGGWQS